MTQSKYRSVEQLVKPAFVALGWVFLAEAVQLLLFAGFFKAEIFTASHWLVSFNPQSPVFINPHLALKLAE